MMLLEPFHIEIIIDILHRKGGWGWWGEWGVVYIILPCHNMLWTEYYEYFHKLNQNIPLNMSLVHMIALSLLIAEFKFLFVF